MMLRKSHLFIILCLPLFFTACSTLKTHKKQIDISKQSIYQPVNYVTHNEPRPFGIYFGQNVNHSEVEKIRNFIDKNQNLTLKHRNEAHITVISPFEFEKELKPAGATFEELEKYFSENIQKTPFKVLCLGEGSAIKENQKQKTFFLVVESKDLLNVRNIIKQKYQNSSFNPQNYFPHITIGYTLKDLHFEDGVIKDLKACSSDLVLNLQE